MLEERVGFEPTDLLPPTVFGGRRHNRTRPPSDGLPKRTWIQAIVASPPAQFSLSGRPRSSEAPRHEYRRAYARLRNRFRAHRPCRPRTDRGAGAGTPWMR